jgi:hypothetical protein
MNPYHDPETGRFTYSGGAGAGDPAEDTAPRNSPGHSERHRAAIAAGRDPRDEHPTRPPGPTDGWSPRQARDYLRALDDAEARRAAAAPPHRPDTPKPGPDWHDPPRPVPPPSAEATRRAREEVRAFEADRAAWGLTREQLARRHADGPRLLRPPGHGTGAPTVNELHNRMGDDLTDALQRQSDLRGDRFAAAAATLPPPEGWPHARPGRPTPMAAPHPARGEVYSRHGKRR